MSNLDRLRDRVGVNSDNRSNDRSRSDEEEVNLSDVEDPHTSKDSTRTTPLEIWERNKWTILAYGMVSTLLVAILLYYTHTYIYSFITNPFVIGGSILIAIFATVWFHGRKSGSRSERRVDEYFQHTPGDGALVRAKGRLTFGGDNNRRFIPYKGKRWFGLKWEPYRHRDFGITENPDEPIRILLPDRTKYRPTDSGTIVGVLANGFKPTPDAPISDFEPCLPDLADKGHIDDLNREIRNKERIIDDLEQQIDTLERQLENAYEDAKETRDEHIGDFVERYTDVRESEPSRITAHGGLESSLNNIEKNLGDDE